MLVGPASTKAQREEFTQEDRGAAGQLHRPADAGALDLPHVRQERHRAAARRPAAVCAGRRRDPDHAGRADARGAEEGLAGGELVAGRRHQGHLGAGGLMLGRTAQNLFWLSRYVERAENMARHARGGLPHEPHLAARGRRERASDLDDAGGRGRRGLRREAQDRRRRDGQPLHAVRRGEPLARSTSCLRAARTNARSVRTALTTDVWETINAALARVRRSSSRDDITGGAAARSCCTGSSR